MPERVRSSGKGRDGTPRTHASPDYYAVMAVLGDALLDAQSEGELWDRTTRALVEEGHFAGACVARADAGGTLRLGSGAGSTHAALAGLGLRLDDTPQSPPALAWSSDEACLERDVRRSSWLGDGAPAAVGSMLAVPVHEGDHVSAVLCVAAGEPDAFDDAAQDLCHRVARLVERWLDHHDQLPHLQHQASHDPLTDLPNRRVLQEHLASALARAKRHGTVVAVGILDLDDFKPINDTCGHVAGDRLLKELASRLRGQLRGHDLLVRLGGDEFALVIDDLAVGRASAELSTALRRLHGAVETPFDLGRGQSADVTMSLGVALYPFDGDEIDQLMRQADIAMYRAKDTKLSRLEWWKLASASQDMPQRDIALAPYGSEAAALLRNARGLLAALSRRFRERLTQDVGTDLDVRARLEARGPLAADGTRLAEHLDALLDPRAERVACTERAEHVGRLHALAGVGPDTVVWALGLFRSLLGEELAASPLTARERYRLLQVAEARLQEELQFELSGHGAAVAEHYLLTAEPLPPPGTPWVDAVQSELDALAALPGIRAATLQRPDADGRLTVEGHAGDIGAQLAALTREPSTVPLATTATGTGGLVGRAWASGEIHRSTDYLGDERTEPWHDALAELGVRSLMAVPVPGPHDRPVAILGLHGALVGQFQGAWAQPFAQALQLRWATLWHRRRVPLRVPALARPVAEHYRERLFAGGLTTYVQPVVDLRNGAVVAGEALARLRLEDGTLLTPGDFLPLLGEVELARLFRLTLDQALAALAGWDARPAADADPAASGSGGPAGPPRQIAVNLSPSTLLEPDCPRWIADALEAHGIAADRLSLELIETEEIGQAARRAAIRGLVELGVHLSIDDLGSGFSSLQRLAELPFDTMKIDQALIGRLYDRPLETLSVVRSLVRLGEDLGRRVVVEGVSDAGLVEVAAVLGARVAQGFGIARPMPAGELAGWKPAFRVPADAGHVFTTAGAMAWHWRASRGVLLTHPPSLTGCPLDGYFRETDQMSSDGARLHARLHAGMHPDEAQAELLDWLMERVQDEVSRA